MLKVIIFVGLLASSALATPSALPASAVATINLVPKAAATSTSVSLTTKEIRVGVIVGDATTKSLKIAAAADDFIFSDQVADYKVGFTALESNACPADLGAADISEQADDTAVSNGNITPLVAPAAQEVVIKQNSTDNYYLNAACLVIIMAKAQFKKCGDITIKAGSESDAGNATEFSAAKTATMQGNCAYCADSTKTEAPATATKIPTGSYCYCAHGTSTHTSKVVCGAAAKETQCEVTYKTSGALGAEDTFACNDFAAAAEKSGATSAIGAVMATMAMALFLRKNL